MAYPIHHQINKRGEEEFSIKIPPSIARELKPGDQLIYEIVDAPRLGLRGLVGHRKAKKVNDGN